MGMSVHQPRHYPGVREVDDFDTGRDGDLRPDLGDLAVLDEDDLALGDGSRGRVDKVPGADGCCLSEGNPGGQQADNQIKG